MSKSPRILRSLLMVFSLFTIAGPLGAAEAQNVKGSWDNLKLLAPGDQIQIVLNDAKSYRGQFQGVSDEAIVVRIATGETAFERQTVLRVSTKTESHRGRNALIGAVAGGAAGLGLGAATGAHSEIGAAAGAGVMALFFAPVGAGIGALMPTGGWRDVYRAR